MAGGLNLWFVAIGALSLLLGIGVMIAALRLGRESPRGVAMLIAGMMASAFGLLMAGFAIAYATGENPR